MDCSMVAFIMECGYGTLFIRSSGFGLLDQLGLMGLQGDMKSHLPWYNFLTRKFILDPKVKIGLKIK